MKKCLTGILLILIVLLATAIRFYEINLPYSKPWELAFQDIIARNHVIYGFGQSHFLSVISVVNGENIYHLAHQPLLQILIAVSYNFFGIHESSARLVPIAASLGCLLLIYAIASRIWGSRTALYSAFFAAFMPMSAYFGRIVNFEPVVLFFVLAFAFSYLVWTETENKNYYFLAIAAVILGGLTDWPFFLVLPFFVMVSVITGKKIRETFLLFLLGCGLAAGYLALKSSVIGYQSGISNWFSHILYRSSIPEFIGKPDLYTQIIIGLWRDFSISIILAIFGIFLWMFLHHRDSGSFERSDGKNLIPAALILFGISYLAIFLESTYVHEWQMYYLIPGVSLYAGFAITYLLYTPFKDRSVSNLVKLTGAILVILFLFLSFQSIITLHQEKNLESYHFGSKIFQWTQSGDYIAVTGIDPIHYYANRPDIQNPTEPLDIVRLKVMKPKIIVLPPGMTGGSNLSREELVQTLMDNDYNLLTTRTNFEIWTRGVMVPDVLDHEYDSLEIFDQLSGRWIPYSGTQGIPLPQVVNNYTSLFEHPLVNNTIRTNYLLEIPRDSELTFGIGLDEKVWDPKRGDGVLFEIYCQSGNNETRIFSQYIDPKNNLTDRERHDYVLNLDICQGDNNKTKIGFATSPGSNNDNSYDWAYWINPRIDIKPASQIVDK